MYIESTFMRYGHGPHGSVVIKMNPSQPLHGSVHICQIVPSACRLGQTHPTNVILRCSIRLGASIAAVQCVHGTNAGHTKEAVEHHKFADNLQMYTSYYPHVPVDMERATQRLCDGIKCWMVQHKLKLNDEKTELMVALSHNHLRKFGLPKNLVVGGATIKPAVSV